MQKSFKIGDIIKCVWDARKDLDKKIVTVSGVTRIHGKEIIFISTKKFRGCAFYSKHFIKATKQEEFLFLIYGEDILRRNKNEI